MGFDIWLRAAAVATTLMWVAPATSDADEQPVAPLIQGDFPIGKDGRLILLPVRLNDREFLCLLDTGASLTGFDVSLRDELGEPAGRRMLNAGGAQIRVESFVWPKVTLDGRPLQTDKPIVCIDLEGLRRLSNAKILGVIGMDVLGSCRIQVDFDNGRLRFLPALPKKLDELGEKVTVQFGPDGTPFIRGTINGSSDHWFLIDTGAQGNSLADDVFDELLQGGGLQPGSTFANATVAGEIRGQSGKIATFQVGRFVKSDLRFERLNLGSLGLRQLSRFRATFDFPGKCLYLRKGDHYDRPEPRATSGLKLNWIDGVLIVESVKQNGAGMKAGVKPGDVLLWIDGKKAERYDPFALRELFTSEADKRILLTIRRGEREVEAALALDSD